MEIKKITQLTLLFFLINSLSASESKKEFWRPVWDKPKKRRYQNIIPKKRNIFMVRRNKIFKTIKKAETFQPANGVIILIDEVEGLFIVRYYESMDLASLIKKKVDSDVDWKSKEAQYSLYKVLCRYYRPSNKIENGKYYYYMEGVWKTEKEVRKFCNSQKKEIEILETRWEELKNGRKLLRVTYRYPVDIIGKAAIRYKGLKAAYIYLIPEQIGDYKCIGASALINSFVSELGVGPGRSGGAKYMNSNYKGVHVLFHLSNQPGSLDHDFMRHLVTNHGIKTITFNNQVLFASKIRKVFAWKASDSTYYRLSGAECEDVLRAYLKKFPSILKKDAKFDEQAWKRKEMDICLKHMEKEARAGNKDKYLIRYSYLIRFFKPIKGAPAFSKRDIELTKKELIYHFSLVEKWWKENRKTFHFKPGRILTGWEIGKYKVYKSGGESIIEDFRKQTEKAAIEIPSDGTIE